MEIEGGIAFLKLVDATMICECAEISMCKSPPCPAIHASIALQEITNIVNDAIYDINLFNIDSDLIKAQTPKNKYDYDILFWLAARDVVFFHTCDPEKIISKVSDFTCKLYNDEIEYE